MKGPIFEGMPSPSVKKMMAMPPRQLRDHVGRLEQEHALLAARLEQEPPQANNPKDQRLVLERRLRLLIEKGKAILGTKGNIA